MFEHSKAEEKGKPDRAIWMVLMWSIWFMWLGIMPLVDVMRRVATDRPGERLCGPFFFVPWIVKCDLDHLAKGFWLRHYSFKHPCELCECHNVLKGTWAMNMCNFATNAAWKATLHSPDTWRTGQALHPIFELEFFTVLNIEPDELHVQHLGTTPYMLGSVLWLLVYVLLTGSPRENMRVIWTQVSQQYRADDCQFSDLTLNSFHDPSQHDKAFPKLKGRGRR